MKCPVCENQIQEKWKYCPQCGSRLEDAKLVYEGYSIERLRNMWVQKGGESFYENFKSVEQVGVIPYSKVKPIRPVLGDFVNIHFSNAKILSIFSLQPNCVKDISWIFRLLGYYSADHALKTVKLSWIVDIISRSRIFWKILANEEVQKALEQGWEGTQEAIVKLEKMAADGEEVTFNIKEDIMFYLPTSKPINFMDLNILGGQLEAICNKKYIGEEKTIDGKRYFVYKLSEGEVEYPVDPLEAVEYDRLVEKVVEYIVNKKPSGRTRLKDIVHISGEQCATYFILKASEGHQILERYSGIKVGRKIAEKASLKGLDESLEYLRELLEYHKVGLLHPAETKGDRMTIRMDESIYASGVNSINMKLCVWLAGLIEGALTQSTQQKWQVEETQCLANGDEHCEFTCKRI